MPEQLSNSNPRRACRAALAQRFTRAASLSVMAVACCGGAPAFAQNAAQPPRPAAQVKLSEAKVKASEEQEKRAATASESTRARRTASPAAAAAATPAATVTPIVTPAKAAPAVAVPAAAVAVEVKSEAASKSAGSEEAELERLRAEIKDAKPSADRARLQRTLVERLVELKRTDEALDALRLMIHEDRYDPPFFFNTGNALARLGDASAAEDAYRKAILQRRGNYARALNNLGVILIRQGHWEEAQQSFSAALLQENYTYAEASYNLARLHLLRGEADRAIREWHRTLRLDPAHAAAAIALARTYAEDGNARRGLAVLDNFVARSTRTSGGASIPREVADARRELVEAGASAADKDDDVANVKTGAAAGGGNYGAGGASVASSRNAVFRGRAVDRATYDLLQTARERRENGSYEESVKSYRAVLQRSPKGYYPPANLELGVALLNLKRDEEAVAALIPLTERDPARYPIVYYHLGRLYERQGQLPLAAESFARAAELFGEANPQILIDLSRLREKTGDLAGALAAVNSYAAVIARQGSVPAWVAERQAKLKQGLTGTPQTSTAKP